MSTQPAPLLLTPELAAEWFSEYGPSGRANKALSDVIDGRTVNVRVLTEDECRAEFDAFLAERDEQHFYEPWDRASYLNRQEQGIAWRFWLACARAMGAVR